MIKINLLPLKVRKTHVTLRLYTYIVIGGSLLGVILVLILIHLVYQTRKTNDQIKAIEGKRQEFSDQILPINRIISEEKESEKIKKTIYDLALEQQVWINILDSLAHQTSDDMWLVKLNAAREQQSNRLSLVVEGEAYHKISIADFLSGLENSVYFSNVRLEALSDQPEKPSQSVKFKITLNYAGALNPGIPGGTK